MLETHSRGDLCTQCNSEDSTGLSVDVLIAIYVTLIGVLLKQRICHSMLVEGGLT